MEDEDVRLLFLVSTLYKIIIQESSSNSKQGELSTGALTRKDAEPLAELRGRTTRNL